MHNNGNYSTRRFIDTRTAGRCDLYSDMINNSISVSKKTENMPALHRI